MPELRWDRVRIAPDSSRAEGVEWLLTRKSADPWSGWLSYTWSRVRDEVEGDGSRELEREYCHWLPLVPSIGVLWRY